MCILIAKPKGVTMPKTSVLKECWENNPDGAGIAWSKDGKVSIEKGFMKWEELKAYLDVNSFDDVSALIHFRIATHGTVKAENTHPFVVNNEIVAAHNGVLSIKNEGDWTDSETFFKRICNPVLKSYSINSKVFKRLVDATIGASKLAFLNSKGRIKMFGEFIEDGGVYFSNDSYKEDRYAGLWYRRNSLPAYNPNMYKDIMDVQEASYWEKEYPYDEWEDKRENFSEMDIEYDVKDDDYIDKWAKERGWDRIFTDDNFDYMDYYEELDAMVLSLGLSIDDANEILDKYIYNNEETKYNY